jgi:hypothetical protein
MAHSTRVGAPGPPLTEARAKEGRETAEGVTAIHDAWPMEYSSTQLNQGKSR